MDNDLQVAEHIINAVLEADDDETIKDILGPEYDVPHKASPEGSVSRKLKNRKTGDWQYAQARWSSVTIGERQFCISYLTPVAYYESGRGVVRTEKNWSTSTIRHIKAWLDFIGMDVSSENWQQVQARFPNTVPQEQLNTLFRQESLKVKWTKRQAKTFGSLPYDKIRTGLRSDPEDRVGIDPEHTPPRPWEQLVNVSTKILRYVLEVDNEDEFLVKDVTAEPEQPVAGRTTVKSFKIGRMKVVDMPTYTFLISYLTPVAYLDKRSGIYYQTSKQWSPTTNGHIHVWAGMIYKSPEWKNNPENTEQGTPTSWNPTGRSVRYPHFERKLQKKISRLFRKLIPSMQMQPHMKGRMYRVDPRMRMGSSPKRWLSGHLKHHDTGEEGLPRPNDREYRDFFRDFAPDKPEDWDWQGSSLRSQEPHETGEDPDEQDISLVLEDDEDENLSKELSGLRTDAELNVQLGKLLPNLIRDKEVYLKKPCIKSVIHTNQNGKTYCFGFFGRGRGQTVSTLLHLDPHTGWKRDTGRDWTANLPESEDEGEFKDVYGEPPARYIPFGTVSRGTMREEDLIPDFLDALAKVDPVEAAEMREAYADEIARGDPEFTWETLSDALNRHTPPFTYFGSHPGNGSDYGVWPNVEAIEQTAEEKPEELQIVDHGQPLPGGSRYVIIQNHHGIYVTLIDGQTGQEIWHYE